VIVGLLLVTVAVVGIVTFDGPGQLPPDPLAAPTSVASPTASPEAPPDGQSPSPSPSPSPTPEPLDATALAIGQRIEDLLVRPDTRVRGGMLAVAVVTGDGREVVTVRPDRALLPASTQKAVVAAAALEVLGPDHRFTTRVVGPAPDDDGVIRGDVYLVGSGDPTLATPEYGSWVYPSRPRAPMERLVRQLRRQGVTRIDGRVVGVAPGFDGPTIPPGWKDDYLWDFNGRHIDGLTVDAGIAVRPTRKGAADPFKLSVAGDPRRRAAAQLVSLLDRRRIGVSDGARPGRGAPPPDAAVLAEIEGPPVADQLRHMMRQSDNHLADTLFRAVGAARGDATWPGSAAAIRDVLADLGLDTTGLVLADGSGLSRSDRLTARFLARLDAVMTTGPHGRHWANAMAVSGREGTLRHRLHGTVGEGRFLGKTGTLDDVASVVGAVTGPDDRSFHLAVLVNDAASLGRWRARFVMDEAVLAIVEELDGCTRTYERPARRDRHQRRTARRGEAPTEPPYTLACPDPVP
jgi:serine-type D-Ala-D-Ala carboxypeptidase/endopeptidase (penicillin-binding protein 4)